jgi:hypothetical protein
MFGSPSSAEAAAPQRRHRFMLAGRAVGQVIVVEWRGFEPDGWEA